MNFQPKKLDKVFWFQEGPGVRNWQFTDHGVKLLNVANIRKTGDIDLSKTDRHLAVEEVESRYAHFLADEGDLVIASSGISIDEDGFLRTRGAFIKKSHLPLCMNTSTIRFKALEGISDLRFLKHWLQSFEFRSQITQEVTGIAQKNFGPSHLKRLTISLPPLAEQKRIAAILDAADALRAERRESLAQLDTLLQSTFLDMFGDPVTNPKGWETTTLPEISIRFTDGPFGSNLKSAHYEDAGVRVIRLQNIGVGEMLDDDLAYISQDHYESLPRNHCKSGDVIIGTLGDPNLRACIVPKELKHALNKADCLLFRPSMKKTLSEYVCWLLNSPATVNKALELVRGQTRGRISMGRLKELIIPLPPLDLQRRFATIVESIEQQKTRMRAHLAELDTLFASLQHRAFNGEL